MDHYLQLVASAHGRSYGHTEAAMRGVFGARRQRRVQTERQALRVAVSGRTHLPDRIREENRIHNPETMKWNE